MAGSGPLGRGALLRLWPRLHQVRRPLRGVAAATPASGSSRRDGPNKSGHSRCGRGGLQRRRRAQQAARLASPWPPLWPPAVGRRESAPRSETADAARASSGARCRSCSTCPPSLLAPAGTWSAAWTGSTGLNPKLHFQWRWAGGRSSRHVAKLCIGVGAGRRAAAAPAGVAGGWAGLHLAATLAAGGRAARERRASQGAAHIGQGSTCNCKSTAVWAGGLLRVRSVRDRWGEAASATPVSGRSRRQVGELSKSRAPRAGHNRSGRRSCC